MSKCALIAFSGCAELLPEATSTHGGDHQDEDAGTDDTASALMQR